MDNMSVSMCRRPSENIASECVLMLGATGEMTYSFFFLKLCKMGSGHIAAVFFLFVFSGCYFQDLFKTAWGILVWFLSSVLVGGFFQHVNLSGVILCVEARKECTLYLTLFVVKFFVQIRCQHLELLSNE